MPLQKLKDHKDSTDVIQKWEEKNFSNSGNLVELLQDRIDRQDKNFEKCL